MRSLKNRLYTVQALVPKGARVADIGTDHGHLPISLVKAGISSFVLACDIREKPLSVAKANIEKCSLKNIETRLGDGLSAIKPNEADCIVIAGMGGEVILNILNSCPWIKDSRYTLILQPMTAAEALRHYLCDNGYKIEEEKAVEDTGRLYCVIKATYCGEKLRESEAFYHVGKLDPKLPTDLKYIQKQFNIANKCRLELEASGRDASEYIKLLEQLNIILGEQ